MKSNTSEILVPINPHDNTLRLKKTSKYECIEVESDAGFLALEKFRDGDSKNRILKKTATM